MKKFQERASELLDTGAAEIVIGYTAGSTGKVQPCFITNSSACDKLIYDLRCVKNLATYLNKHEIKSKKKICIFANIYSLRSIMQLYAEKQLNELEMTILFMQDDADFVEFSSMQEVEKLLLTRDYDNQELAESSRNIAEMNAEDKWAFWTKELASCIKCYACRSACPMCYCTSCMTECNMPQWVSIPSLGYSNMEWHILRAMHLAGRCVDCGECARACPAEIPLNLLTYSLNRTIENKFGHKADITCKTDYVLSEFKVEDKENFIR